MKQEEIDTLWYKAMSQAMQQGELYTRYKFAELIVQECAKVAFNDWCDGTNEGSSQMAILKHFGVK